MVDRCAWVVPGGAVITGFVQAGCGQSNDCSTGSSPKTNFRAPNPSKAFRPMHASIFHPSHAKFLELQQRASEQRKVMLAIRKGRKPEVLQKHPEDWKKYCE